MCLPFIHPYPCQRRTTGETALTPNKSIQEERSVPRLDRMGEGLRNPSPRAREIWQEYQDREDLGPVPLTRRMARVDERLSLNAASPLSLISFGEAGLCV